MAQLTYLDYIVFFLCLIITLLASLFAYQKSKNEKNNLLYFILMGRKLSLPIFIATLVSTWYGGIFGVSQIAYESGIYNFITQGLFWYFTYLIMAFFFVKKIKDTKAYTLPDLVEKLFGKKAGKLAAVFNFFNVLPIVYTISLGLFLQSLFGGNQYLWMLTGLIFVLFYSAVSGFRAIVYTDIIQFFVMCFAVFLVLLYSIMNYGGMGFLTNNLDPHYFHISADQGWLSTFAWGFIALSSLIDPNFYQRIFAAKNSKVAKKGILISTLVWLFFDLCTTFGAMYAKAAMPDLDSSNAYLIYAFSVLPAGLAGFFLAGVLATILSTMDSYIFIAGNTISYDLLRLRTKNKKLHRLSIVFVGLLSLLMAYIFDGNIRMVWKTLGSYSAGALLAPIVYGIYFKNRLREKYFIRIVLVSCFSITLWRYLDLNKNVDDLYIGLATSLLGILFCHLFYSKQNIQTNN